MVEKYGHKVKLITEVMQELYSQQWPNFSKQRGKKAFKH